MGRNFVKTNLLENILNKKTITLKLLRRFLNLSLTNFINIIILLLLYFNLIFIFIYIYILLINVLEKMVTVKIYNRLFILKMGS
jgi:hypothetical protein